MLRPWPLPIERHDLPVTGDPVVEAIWLDRSGDPIEVGTLEGFCDGALLSERGNVRLRDVPVSMQGFDRVGRAENLVVDYVDTTAVVSDREREWELTNLDRLGLCPFGCQADHRDYAWF